MSMPRPEMQVQIRDWNFYDFCVCIIALKQLPAMWITVQNSLLQMQIKKIIIAQKKLSLHVQLERGWCIPGSMGERERSCPVRKSYGPCTFVIPRLYEDFAVPFSPSHSGLDSAVWLGGVHYMSLSEWFTNSLKSPAKPAGAQLFILLSCCFLFLWGQS